MFCALLLLAHSSVISIQIHFIWPSKWRAENMKHDEYDSMTQLPGLWTRNIDHDTDLRVPHRNITYSQTRILKNNHYWQMMFCMWGVFREREGGEGELFLGQGCHCHCLHIWVTEDFCFVVCDFVYCRMCHLLWCCIISFALLN